MKKITVEFEHKYNIGDIIEFKNQNNDKSLFGKVLNIDIDIINEQTGIGNMDIIKHIITSSSSSLDIISYKIYYEIKSLSNSYYDCEKLTEIPLDTYFYLNNE